MEKTKLQLPVQISTKIEVGRLLSELEELDNFLSQADIRKPGTPTKLPKMSRLLDEFIEINKLNPLHKDDRKIMLDFIKTVRLKAPTIHLSFGVDPSAVFIQKLTTWLRGNIHPLVLLHIGLQPNIGAGCVVRTTNKHFDFSLREHFKKQRSLLIEKIHSGASAATAKQSQEPEAQKIKVEASS